MEVERDFLFATEIFKIKLHNYNEVNQQLLTQYNTSRKYHQQNEQKNIFVSMEHMPSTQCVLLRATAIDEALTKQTLQIDANNWWFNILQPKTLVETQNYSPGPVWSGIYYIAAPKDCGELGFTHQRTHIKEPKITKKVKTFYYKYIGHNFKDVMYKPEPGMMYIFPSWLDHRTELNNSSEDTITISFNLRYPFAIL